MAVRGGYRRRQQCNSEYGKRRYRVEEENAHDRWTLLQGLIRKEDDGERKWGRTAVHHLKKVEELETDKSKKFEIRNMLRVWERSVPEVKVVPRVPDSTPYPKEALANY